MKKFIFLITILLIVSSFSLYAGINSGLVAYYPFDGNSNDMSGNGHNGTEYGGISYVSGKIGQAARFDGVNDFIKIYSGGELIGESAFTFSAWIKPYSLAKTKYYQNTIFTQNDNNNGYVTNDILIGGEKYSSDNSIVYDNYPPRGGWVKSYTKINKNQWTHIVVVKYNQKVTFYINGIKDVEHSYTESVSSSTTSSIDNVLIGSRYFKGKACCQYHGLLDEVRIYNRALSQSEVTSLYNGSGSSGSSGGFFGSCYTKDDVDAAYAAGVSYCKNHPSECGINTTNFVGECASFDMFTNTLHIPCLNLGKNYWLDLNLINSNPIQFGVSGYGEK